MGSHATVDGAHRGVEQPTRDEVDDLATVLFRVKYAVQDLEAELVDLQTQIAGERRAIHVLEAEWSHLTDPETLRQRARRHLELAPLTPRQIGSFASLEPPPPEAPPEGGDVADWTNSPAAAAVVLGTEVVQ